jgi:hypothetical protein
MGGAAFRTEDAAFVRRSLRRATRPLGPAGVLGLADPVELPYWNKTEMCHALHLTLAPFSFPLDRCPSLYHMSRPVEVYFYSNPALLTMQGSWITTASHSVVWAPPTLRERSPMPSRAPPRRLQVTRGRASAAQVCCDPVRTGFLEHSAWQSLQQRAHSWDDRMVLRRRAHNEKIPVTPSMRWLGRLHPSSRATRTALGVARVAPQLLLSYAHPYLLNPGSPRTAHFQVAGVLR